MGHNERCRDCKETVKAMLERIYGTVISEHRVYCATFPEDYQDKPCYAALSGIYRSLQQYRGAEDFVRAGYVKIDFYVPEPGFAVEFDESQHFTQPRHIALEAYPPLLKVGYSVHQWKTHCEEIDAHDNDPPYRDEQRAWYDTLRDFLPEIKGFLPTVRLYAGEMVWCDLDPEDPTDVERFKRFLDGRRMRSTTPKQTMDRKDVPSRKEQDTTDLMAAPPECMVTAEEGERTGMPVPLSLLRFEYLTNAVKLRYLEDCFAYPVNRDAPYFSRSGKPVDGVRLTSSNGKPFQVYLNKPIYVGGGEGSVPLGPLLSGIAPDNYLEISDLSAVNYNLSAHGMQTDDWFRLFCEFTLVKTSIHELITDTEEHEQDWGHYDLAEILRVAGTGETIGGSDLRDLVVHAIRLGLDPSRISPDENHSVAPINHLSSLPYRAFMARRDEWIGAASSALADICSRITPMRISSVMKWDSYSACAFESGPVFIRKEPTWLLPQVTDALASFSGWGSGRPAAEMMSDLLSPHLHILIGSYWYHFKEGCEVRFFENNRNLAETIPPLRQQLDGYWAKLAERAESVPSPPMEDRPTRCNAPKSRGMPYRDQKPEKPKNVLPSKVSFEDQRKRAHELGLGEFFERLTTGFEMIFPVRTVEKSAVIYRIYKTMGYPVTDVFNLYTRGSNKKRGLKFRVYYNIFAVFLGQNTSKEDILKMLPRIVRDEPRMGRVDQEGEWFFEGYFTSTQEIDHLLTAIRAKMKSV